MNSNGHNFNQAPSEVKMSILWRAIPEKLIPLIRPLSFAVLVFCLALENGPIKLGLSVLANSFIIYYAGRYYEERKSRHFKYFYILSILGLVFALTVFTWAIIHN